MSANDAAMAHIPYGDGLSTPFVRTDFGDEDRWRELLNLAQAKYENEFSAKLYIIDNKIFDGFDPIEICKVADNKNHGEVFIVDKFTMYHPDFPILCVNLDDASERFRVIPQKLWSPQNNLVLANMDFEEFVSATDSDGIYRGF